MTTLYYIPKKEFDRTLGLPVNREERTALFADMCRLNTLYMIKAAGSGHIGSSFSSLDIVSWLLLNELREEKGDVYYSSKGHDVPGLYAALLALGRLPFEKIHQLRRLGGLPGHPDVVTTPEIVTNTGSLGMGISKAKGMVLANRLNKRSGRVFVLTGDGELQEGQFWESLSSAVNRRMHEITVIIDHNKVQSDTLVSRVNDLGDLEAKLRAFGWYVERCDGHSFPSLSRALAACAAVQDKPKIIIADTVKGRGVSFMEHTVMKPEQRRYLFHSGAPDDENYHHGVEELSALVNDRLREHKTAALVLERVDRSPPQAPDRVQRMVAAYGQALVAEAKNNDRIVALDADLAFDTGLLPFEERFPERFFECGIAEQDMISQAGAMALRDMLPAVHSFACFLSTRPNEQFYNNASEKTRVVYVGSLAGLVPAAPGHSHQAVRDIAALSAIPGLVMLEPCCEDEVAQAVAYCFREAKGSSYLRLVSVPCEVPYELPAGYRLTEGKGVALREGKDAVIIAYGPVMLTEAWQAAQRIEERVGLSVAVVNLPWLNRLDASWLEETVRGYPWLFTADNHYVEGGQGQRIAAALAGLHLKRPPRIHCFGIREIPECGQIQEVLRAHGLDAESLSSAMLAHLRGE